MGRGWIHGHRLVAGAKRGKLFNKLSREISVAVKMGGSNPEGNARLKMALKEARQNSMPKDTIDRAVKKGAGADNTENFDEITYEGYGPHQVAFVVETLTDNKNRTAQDIRALFTKYGAGLGESGSVLWGFDRVSFFIAKAAESETEVDAEEVAISIDADDVEAADDGFYHFYGKVEYFAQISKALSAMNWQIEKETLVYKPKNLTDVNEEQEKEVQDFFNKLDDHDDVKNIYLSL